MISLISGNLLALSFRIGLGFANDLLALSLSLGLGVTNDLFDQL